MKRRSRAREVALQLLFQFDNNGKTPREAVEPFATQRLREPALVKFCMALYEGVSRHVKDIDQKLAQAAENWRVARMTGTNTEFGMQFDSLADVVSFGIAPAVTAFAWGVRSLPAQGTAGVQQLSEIGWVCCLAFLLCCAWRLARFNVQGMALGSSKYFVGMPTPAAAGVIAALNRGSYES